MKWIIRTVALALTGFVMAGAFAQPSRTAPPPAIKKPSKPIDDEGGRVGRDAHVPEIDAELVTIPVVAKSTTGQYVADLTKEDLTVAEDGAPQQIASFTTVNVPFHVVLLLDTSASTREHLSALQRAAIAFVEQLSAADKVKLISFNDSVRDWNAFTADKGLVRNVIGQIEPGSGTKVYDAIDSALRVLRPITGKKAIVIFSDAYDWRSESATFEASLRNLEESGVVVYPVRFETRAETERIARQQDAATSGANLPTSETIQSNPTTTPPTVPSNDPDQPGRSSPDPMSIIFGRPGARTGQDPRAGKPDPRDSKEENPKSDPGGPKVVRVPRAPEKPTDPFPRTPDPPPPVAEPASARRLNDPIKTSLDQAYLRADNYLNALAQRSGGQVYRADTMAAAPRAFAAIATELRTQYLLGYYPTNQNYDNAYRKLEVRTSRSNVTIRARPGYRMPRGN